MDGNWLQRTELLIGSEGLARLQSARVAILGLGGVGSAAAEALCRAGVGHLLLIDHDRVDLTNLNRQLVATREVVGWRKTDAQEKRLRSILPSPPNFICPKTMPSCSTGPPLLWWMRSTQLPPSSTSHRNARQGMYRW